MSAFLQRILSKRLRMRARRWLSPIWLGSMNRITPLSNEWGFDRGTPVDRHFIERFLESSSADIHGRVLEIKDSTYTDRYGDRVVQRDVLDIDATNTSATIIADLSQPTAVPSATFDCFILTQTLHLIYDTKGCIEHAHRILKPGGVLLVTLPVISRIAPRYGLDTDYWRFTPVSCRRLFGDVFGNGQVRIETAGNLYAASAFLHGLAIEEIRPEKLLENDPYFPILVTVRAQKTLG